MGASEIPAQPLSNCIVLVLQLFFRAERRGHGIWLSDLL